MSFTLRFSLFAALVAASSSPALGASVVVPINGHDTHEAVAFEQTGFSTILSGAKDLPNSLAPFTISEVCAVEGALSEALVACLPATAFWADANDVYTGSLIGRGGAMVHGAESFASTRFAGLLDAFSAPMDPTSLLDVNAKVSLSSSRLDRMMVLAATSGRVLAPGAGGAFSARHDWFSGSQLRLSGASFVHEPLSSEQLNRGIVSLAGGF